MSRVGRDASAWSEAGRMIGRRVRFDGEPHTGTIIARTKTSNGYVRYVVDWGAGAPEWWSSVIAPTAGALIIEDDDA